MFDKCLYWYESTFSRAECSYWSEIDAVNTSIQFATSSQTNWLQKWFFFRSCSVAANLVTSSSNPFQSAGLLCCVILANSRTVRFWLTSLISAALLQAVLQAIEEPLRNTLVKLRNQIVERRNGLGKLLDLVQKVSKWNPVTFQLVLRHHNSQYFNFISSDEV